MVQIILVGFGAGIASALLFASIASGALISILLFYLAPLPILIAALGWSHWAGLLAAIVASIGLAATFNFYVFAAFLVAIALPAWWLSYLALLARPVSAPGGETHEWYPVGRLVLWTALASALVIAAALLSLGTSEETLRAALHRGFQIMLRLQETTPEGSSRPEIGRQIDALVRVAPPAAAVSITLVNLLMLWLAARIVKVSGRLPRPWPELSAMEFPAAASILLAAAVAGLLLAGLSGIIASVLAASLATAYTALGFTVLHAITRGMNSRTFALTCVYVSVVFVTPALVIIALLGLADTAFNIRGRIAGKRGPPTLRT